jgi:hypothetical protein
MKRVMMRRGRGRRGKGKGKGKGKEKGPTYDLPAVLHLPSVRETYSYRYE